MTRGTRAKEALAARANHGGISGSPAINIRDSGCTTKRVHNKARASPATGMQNDPGAGWQARRSRAPLLHFQIIGDHKMNQVGGAGKAKLGEQPHAVGFDRIDTQE